MPNLKILQKNVLYLIPTPISDSVDMTWNSDIIHNISHFVVENAKTARQFLKQIKHPVPLQNIEIIELNKHEFNHQEILAFLKQNTLLGLMSESGFPCIADPGAKVVHLAQNNDFQIKPLAGPSSIFMALGSSGFNGQKFKFNGYLSPKPIERKTEILSLEKELINQNCTQLFIETPYRNNQILKDLIQTLQANTGLCIAMDISGNSELIISKPVNWWRQNEIVLEKLPCIFMIGKY